MTCSLSSPCYTLRTNLGIKKWPRLSLPTRNTDQEAQASIDIGSSSVGSSSSLNFEQQENNLLQNLRFSHHDRLPQLTSTTATAPAHDPSQEEIPHFMPTIEHSAIKQLEPNQLEELALWRITPGISNFLDKLELAMSDLVKKLTKVEPCALGPQELHRLIEVFSEGEQAPAEKIPELLHRFIEEVYQCRLNSNFPYFLANVYKNNEYEIYKYCSNNLLQMESYTTEILNYIERLNAKASKYYEEAAFEIDDWEEKIASILLGFKWAFKHLEEESLMVWRNQIRARCGDRRLFDFLEDSARQDLSVDKIQHFLLQSTKGMDQAKRERLLEHTDRLHNDMWGSQEFCNTEA